MEQGCIVSVHVHCGKKEIVCVNKHEVNDREYTFCVCVSTFALKFSLYIIAVKQTSWFYSHALLNKIIMNDVGRWLARVILIIRNNTEL